MHGQIRSDLSNLDAVTHCHIEFYVLPDSEIKTKPYTSHSPVEMYGILTVWRIQSAKEPHIKSTGVRNAGKPHHIQLWSLAPYKASPQVTSFDFFNCAKELQPYFKESAIWASFFAVFIFFQWHLYFLNIYSWSRISSTGSVNRKRSKSRSRDASRSPAKSRQRADRPKNCRRSSSQTNHGESNSPILEQLLDKISSLSSTVEKLNERMTRLESAPVKDTDNMVVEQEDASCPEPTDVSDQLTVVIRPDPEIERYGPVILDLNSSDRVGNITSKSLTQGHSNGIACLSENNGDCERIFPRLKANPIKTVLSTYLLILWLKPPVGSLLQHLT